MSSPIHNYLIITFCAVQALVSVAKGIQEKINATICPNIELLYVTYERSDLEDQKLCIYRISFYASQISF